MVLPHTRFVNKQPQKVVYFSLTYEDELDFISLSLFCSSIARWSIKQRVLRSFYLHQQTQQEKREE